MVCYILDLSTLTIDQMKAINRIINHSCGKSNFKPTCGLCEAMEAECWEREGSEHLGVEIAMCG